MIGWKIIDKEKRKIMRKLSEAEWISRFEQVQGRKPKPDELQDPPQPVAAKSLMLKPPKIYLQFIIFYGWQNVRKIHWYTFFCVCGIICNRMYEKK